MSRPTLNQGDPARYAPNNRSRALRLACTAVAVLAVLLLAAPRPSSARSGGAASQVALPSSLEQAVRAATLAAQPASAKAAIFVSPIAQADGWVFGTSAIISAADEATEPQILLFIAKQEPGGWRVAIEHTAAFDDALAQVPDGLLSAQQRATTVRGPQLLGNGSMQLSLPWAAGETQYLTGGPHGTRREAIDFSGGTGVARAARDGTAYLPCGASSDYVRIDHGGGLSTNYYHLSGISVANGQAVSRSTALGRQGTSAGCLGGSATGAHVHFWITQSGTSIAINGIDIGGWTVSAGAQEYYGCMTRVRDGLQKCVLPKQQIPNEGLVGSGGPAPKMDVNTPGSGQTVAGEYVIGGWAIHEAAASGTGVDAVHVYFDGPAGSGARGVAATYGIQRDDVAAAYGDRYRYSGYHLVNNSADLSLGQHTVYVYAHSTVTDQWQMMTRTFTVGNASPNIPSQATPTDGATVSGPTVQFTWQDPGDPDNRPRQYRDYTVEVKNGAGQIVAQMPWTATQSWSASLADGAYTWHIQSGDGAVGSGWSPDWRFTVSSAIAKPSDLAGQVTAGGIRLTWRDNAVNETGFRVYRWRGEDLTWPLIGAVQSTEFTDPNVVCGVTYFYLVSAYNASSESEREGWVSVAMPACSPPGAPGSPFVSDPRADSLTISWGASSGTLTGYNLYRYDDVGGVWDYVLIAQVPADTRTYVDVGLTCETTYRYLISAYSAAGESPRVDTPVTQSGLCPVFPPTGLRVTASGQQSVDLSWSDDNTWEQGFNVYRWNGQQGAWDLIAGTGANSTAYRDSGLACGTTYFYEVKAYRNGRVSDSAGWITADTQPCSPTPTATATVTATATATSTREPDTARYRGYLPHVVR